MSQTDGHRRTDRRTDSAITNASLHKLALQKCGPRMGVRALGALYGGSVHEHQHEQERSQVELCDAAHCYWKHSSQRAAKFTSHTHTGWIRRSCSASATASINTIHCRACIERLVATDTDRQWWRVIYATTRQNDAIRYHHRMISYPAAAAAQHQRSTGARCGDALVVVATMTMILRLLYNHMRYLSQS